MKNIIKFIAFNLLIVFLFLGFASVRASADTITSLYDNFDSYNGGKEENVSTNFGYWNVSSGNVDLIGNGDVWDVYPGNGLYVDLAGTQFGSITTKDYFSPGVYEVTISVMGARPSNESDGYYMNFGSNVYSSPTGGYGANLSVTEIWTITNESQFTVGDLGKSGDRYSGATLMSVSIQEQSAIPEPSAVVLFGVGLSALIFMATRRRKKATSFFGKVGSSSGSDGDRHRQVVREDRYRGTGLAYLGR